MSNNDVILGKMREANIPPFTFKTTLTKEGLKSISDMISHGDYRVGNGSELRSFLVMNLTSINKGKTGTRQSIDKVTALMAKELVLCNEQVYFAPFAELMRHAKMYENGNAQEVRDIRHLLGGIGYLVIPDFPCERRNAEFDIREFEDVLAHLTRFVAKGGALVLGTPGIAKQGQLDSVLPYWLHATASILDAGGEE